MGTTTYGYSSDNIWHYYAFSEIVSYKLETYPPCHLDLLRTFAADGEKTSIVFPLASIKLSETQKENATQIAIRILDAIIADNKKNGLLI